MDVMGGIADYSGALVLQMPIAEACHVVIQRQAQVSQAGQVGLIVGHITVVSFNKEASHRSPVFQAPLSDIFPSGQPLSYEEARSYFKVHHI
jgi:L-arabinokinase